MSITHIATLVLSLLGFVALAMGTERYAKHVLRKVPPPRIRLATRLLGWFLLAVALSFAMRGLDTGGVGMAVWTGWLSLAALALIFALPKWPWQPPVKATPVRAPRAKAGAAEEAPLRKPRRWIGLALLGAGAIFSTAAFYHVETKPLHRDDAIKGQIGPWTFTIAETDRKTPEVAHMDVPVKAYMLRFCEACDLEVLRAYLKVNKPRAMRASGIAFGGNRWDRNAEIQLPANMTGDSELWLTVVGKNGEVHQRFWPMSSISPATVAWFEQQRNVR